jgi:hypothetical protein
MVTTKCRFGLTDYVACDKGKKANQQQSDIAFSDLQKSTAEQQAVDTNW